MEFLRKIGLAQIFNTRLVNANKSKGSSSSSLKVEPNTDAGGEDFYDARAAMSDDDNDSNISSPDHLVIMVNGLVGSKADWKFAAEQFVKKLPDKVIVHRSESNSAKSTFDGIDVMGERLAQEVRTVACQWPELQKISFVAHSLGGLIARYSIGKLYECDSTTEPMSHNGDHLTDKPEKQPNEAKIAGLDPINFITVATPHLGSRGHKQLPFLFGLQFLERSASQTAHLIVGKTGKHLFLTDGDDDGRPPLLLQMAKDSHDLKFISALRAFKRRVAYANVNYDHMVGWRTSSIRLRHQLPKSNLLAADEKYPHVVNIEKGIAENVRDKSSSVDGYQTTDVEEEMIKGLTQVPWERVDVSFERSTQRFVAHNTIQVKNYWLHSDGVDVIYHIIDNFDL